MNHGPLHLVLTLEDALKRLMGMGGTAAAEVLRERQRQMSQEGWTPEHDDEHQDNSLIGADGGRSCCGAQSVARTTKELEYVQALVEGHARIFWQSLPRDNPDPAAVPNLVKDAIYRAAAQALRDFARIPLPPNRRQFENILMAIRRQGLFIDPSAAVALQNAASNSDRHAEGSAPGGSGQEGQ